MTARVLEGRFSPTTTIGKKAAALKQISRTFNVPSSCHSKVATAKTSAPHLDEKNSEGVIVNIKLLDL